MNEGDRVNRETEKERDKISFGQKIDELVISKLNLQVEPCLYFDLVIGQKLNFLYFELRI